MLSYTICTVSVRNHKIHWLDKEFVIFKLGYGWKPKKPSMDINVS